MSNERLQRSFSPMPETRELLRERTECATEKSLVTTTGRGVRRKPIIQLGDLVSLRGE